MHRADLLTDTYARITAIITAGDVADFERPTRAEAWDVRELVFHLLLDAQRALVAFASVTRAAADVDAVTYWAPFRPSEGDGGRAHALFVQRAARAYDVAGLIEQWHTTSAAAARAAAAAPAESRVETQGHVLAVPNFISTLVVEAVVHLLDLTLELPGQPSDQALVHTRRVLDALMGEPLPQSWDDPKAVLIGTGRVVASEADLVLLGAGAARLPLLG